MNPNIHPRLQPLSELVGVLEVAGRESVKALRQSYHRRTRLRIGSTLRPGPDTPIWNELAKVTAAHLTHWGDKALLARQLGVPRQRLHEYLVAKTACPDTERALHLLAWLLARRNPSSPVWSPSRPAGLPTRLPTLRPAHRPAIRDVVRDAGPR